jgi:hypothetical protein
VFPPKDRTAWNSWDVLYISPGDMAPAFLHRPPSPARYSYHFRGALILYWFRIASDMATMRVRPCPLHERWFIAHGFKPAALRLCLSTEAWQYRIFLPQLPTIHPSFFSASGPQNRDVPLHPPTNLSIFCVFWTWVSFLYEFQFVSFFSSLLFCASICIFPNTFLLNSSASLHYLTDLLKNAFWDGTD